MTRIAVLLEEPQWQTLGRDFPSRLRRAARAAYSAARKVQSGDLSILLADDARLAELNTRFRGKKKPTNVLSFPSADPDYLGDVAIAFGVTVKEAGESGKSIHDHAIHLAVHGVLHLLGYDHESAREAQIMEPLETAILKSLGIADPYAARPAVAE